MLDADVRFVEQAYLDLLDRAADQPGLEYWTSQLAQKAPQGAIAQQLTHSAEYYGNQVVKPAYQTFLGRAPGASEINYWVGRMQNGLTDEQLEAGFIGSAEFYSRAGNTDLTWVDAMYLDLLGRPADSAGQAYWVQQLQHGASRWGVAQGFAASLEREAQLVQDDYGHFLHRDAAAAEVDYWVAQFAHRVTNETVIGGFVGSTEYFNYAQTSPDTQRGRPVQQEGVFSAALAASHWRIRRKFLASRDNAQPRAAERRGGAFRSHSLAVVKAAPSLTAA